MKRKSNKLTGYFIINILTESIQASKQKYQLAINIKSFQLHVKECFNAPKAKFGKLKTDYTSQ